MGRSSEVLNCLPLPLMIASIVLAGYAATGQGAALAGGTVVAGTGIAGHGIGLGGRGPGAGGHGGRGSGLPGGYPRGFPQQFVGAGPGFYELNSGLPNPTFDATSEVEADDGEAPFYAPPLGFIPAPPPCVTPSIIRVGRGIRHRASTKVIYGQPPCGPR